MPLWQGNRLQRKPTNLQASPDSCAVAVPRHVDRCLPRRLYLTPRNDSTAGHHQLSSYCDIVLVLQNAVRILQVSLVSTANFAIGVFPVHRWHRRPLENKREAT
jgi:hypothetical protein